MDDPGTSMDRRRTLMLTNFIAGQADDVRDAFGELLAERNRLRAAMGAHDSVLRMWAERVAIAAGVSVTWEADSTVGEPGAPKYNDRLIRDVEVALAERNRLQALIGAVRDARDPTIAVGLPPDEVGRRVRDYFEAIDRLLIESGEVTDGT